MLVVWYDLPSPYVELSTAMPTQSDFSLYSLYRSHKWCLGIRGSVFGGWWEVCWSIIDEAQAAAAAETGCEELQRTHWRTVVHCCQWQWCMLFCYHFCFVSAQTWWCYCLSVMWNFLSILKLFQLSAHFFLALAGVFFQAGVCKICD